MKIEYVPALIVQPNVELVHPPLLSAAIEQSSASSSLLYMTQWSKLAREKMG